MQIINGILQEVPYQPARWFGGEIKPGIVVLHDTASRISKGSAARYLRDNDRKVSVHFVIERDGEIVQQVPVDRRASHAGVSEYHGRTGCNDFSIGIEFVNPGRMSRFSSIEAQTWYGQRFSIAEYGIQECETAEHGRGLWMPYTEGQIGSGIDLLQALFNGVPTLRDIVAHWYISPSRKVDVNPLFPLEQVRSILFGREEPRDAEVKASEMTPNGSFVQINTPGDRLNLRRWPSFNPNVIATIPDDAVVPVLRRGVFSGRSWLSVLYGGHEGWVVADYADPIMQKEI